MIQKTIKALFFKNAFANVIGGAGAALFNLVLPALVVRHLSKMEFSVWTLALQVVVYMQMFGFGLQTVVTYYVAKASANDDLADQKTTIRASLALVARFCLVAAAALVVLVAVYPVMFDNLPPAMTNEFRAAVGLLGSSAIFQLIALVPAGMFAGTHRNIVPVLSQLFVRCLSLAVLYVVLKLDGSLLSLAAALAACGALLVPINFVAGKKWAAERFERFGAVDGARLQALFKDCGGLAVFSVAMLLVNGVDIFVVGHFDFAKVGAFSLATTVITILVGVLQAILSPLIALGSAINAKNESGNTLENLLVLASKYCSIFLVAATVAVIFFGSDLLPFWIGNQYVADVEQILVVLFVAHGIRNLMAPYSILLVSVGKQRKALLPAITEGIVNLVASLALVTQIGALGVAYGTLVGAVAGVAASMCFVVSDTKELVASRTRFVQKVLALPFCGFLALFLFNVVR